MGRIWLTTAAVGIVMAGTVAGSSPALASAGQERVTAAPAPGALDAAFDGYMRAAVQNAAFSGTVLVARDGVPLFQRSYGMASLELGVWQFDTSSAGLGGCPYAKGATGNVATEDVVYMLHGMGIETGIDLDRLIDAGVYISQALGREPNSRASKAIRNKRLETAG